MKNQWRLSYTGPALVVSSGLVFYAEKRPKGLSLEDVLGMIKEHPGQGYYEKLVKRRVTLGDALSLGRFSELGTEKLMTSSLDFYRVEHDRDFLKLPKSGGALLRNKYQSKPRRA